MREALLLFVLLKSYFIDLGSAWLSAGYYGMFIILLLCKLCSAGGLVTAVAPVVIDCDGLWVGWTGLDDFNTGNFLLKRFLKKFLDENNMVCLLMVIFSVITF